MFDSTDPAASDRPPISSETSTAPPSASTLPEMEGMDTNQLWELYAQKRDEAGGRQSEFELVRNEILERHRPLVRFIALRLLKTLPKSVELDDLISAGTFGLLDAIRKFDPSRGIKFKTYCPPRIRGSILDQLRSEDWVPRLVRIKANRIDSTIRDLTSEYGREPTHTELAVAMKLDHTELSCELESAKVKSMYSFSDKWEDRDDDDAAESYDFLEDKGAQDPMAELNKRDMMKFMTRSLTHKERFIIEQYYQSGHTMREIGEMLTLTESRVCQIHSNVMARLKSLISPSQATLLA